MIKSIKVGDIVFERSGLIVHVEDVSGRTW
jgi:hypothetical protein